MKKTVVSVATLTALTGTSVANIHAEEVTVKSGDSLWGIANAVGTTVADLKKANNLSSNLIHPGDVLSYSQTFKKAAANTADTDANTYTVKAGDTLWAIGSQFGVSFQSIMEANNLKSDLIFPGQTLSLNGNTAVVEEVEAVEETKAVEEVAVEEVAPAQEVKSEAGAYVIESGDTLYKISRETGVDVNTLKELNGLKSDLIFPGQVLVLTGEVAPKVEEVKEVKPVEEFKVEAVEVVEETPVVEEVVEETPVVEEVAEVEVQEEAVEEVQPAVETEEVEVVEEAEVVNNEQEVAEANAQAEAEKAQAEADRVAAEEQARVAEQEAQAKRDQEARAQAERNRVAAEKAEADRIAAERYAAEQAEAARVAAEQEAARVAEAERQAQAEADRQARAQAEADRKAAEQRQAQKVAKQQSQTKQASQPAATPVASTPKNTSYGQNYYYYGDCTWYAFERRKELGLSVSNMWGNGNDWADNARNNGYTVNKTPSVGAIVHSYAGTNGAYGMGHVAIVEQINPDGSIVVSEMGWPSVGVKTTRTISAGNVASHNFIH